jgi:hypothetical protein
MNFLSSSLYIRWGQSITNFLSPPLYVRWGQSITNFLSPSLSIHICYEVGAINKYVTYSGKNFFFFFFLAKVCQLIKKLWIDLLLALRHSNFMENLRENLLNIFFFFFFFLGTSLERKRSFYFW